MGMSERDMPVIVKERDYWVEFHSQWSRSNYREKKFRCFGGPFHGEWWSRTQLQYACPGYLEFNNAGGSYHRAVFVWTEEDI
jgi:hypothetical protein